MGNRDDLGRHGADVAADVAGRISIIGVDVRLFVLDTFGLIRARRVGTFVPVVRTVLAPIAVAVLMGGRRGIAGNGDLADCGFARTVRRGGGDRRSTCLDRRHGAVRGYGGNILVRGRPSQSLDGGVLRRDRGGQRFAVSNRNRSFRLVKRDLGNRDDLGRQGADVAADVTGSVRVIGVDVRLCILDAFGLIRARRVGAFVPVIRTVLAPIAVAVLMRGLGHGADVAADVAGSVRIIGVDVGAVWLVWCVAAVPSACMSTIVVAPDRFAGMVRVVEATLGYAAALTLTGLDGAAGCRLPIVTERRKHTHIDVAAGGAGKDFAASVRAVCFSCYRAFVEFVTAGGTAVRHRQGGVPGTAQTVIIFVIGLVFDDTAVHVSAHILRHVADRQGGVPMNLSVYTFGIHIDRAVLCRHVGHGLAVLADLPNDIGAVGKPLRDVNAKNRVGVLGHRQILWVAGGRRIQRSGGCDIGDDRTEVIVHDTAVLPGRTRSDLVPAFGSGFVFARQIFKGSAVVLTSLPPVMQILPVRFHRETIIGINGDRYFIRIGREVVIELLLQPVNHAFGLLGNDGQSSDRINGDRVGSALRQLLVVCIDTVNDTDLPAFHGIGDGCRFIHGGGAVLYRFPVLAVVAAQLPAVPEGNAVKGCAVGHLQACRLTVDIAIRLLQLHHIHIQGGVIVIGGPIPLYDITIADLAPVDVSVLRRSDLRDHVFKANGIRRIAVARSRPLRRLHKLEVLAAVLADIPLDPGNKRFLQVGGISAGKGRQHHIVARLGNENAILLQGKGRTRRKGIGSVL